MKLFSTNDKNNTVSLRHAVLNAFPPDGGLYMPCELPQLYTGFFREIKNLHFTEIAFRVCEKLLSGAIPDEIMWSIIQSSFDFPIKSTRLDTSLCVQELYHGPSLAFKDFGARFMAHLMSYYLKDNDEKRTVLVATSGDTGGAAAAGFYDVPNIELIILYPSGKVSALQEKQLCCWGNNIHTIEIEGSFDDCQRLVKEAFLDKQLCRSYTFSSANSINIARLIPQSFYYFEAYKNAGIEEDLSICVPSGNFGNITAGLMAYKMGLPVKHFIAATNSNNTFTSYYKSGVYQAQAPVETISNAMDVGDPSNYPRLMFLLGSTWNKVKEIMRSWSHNDKDTRNAIKEVWDKYNYLLDPHSAVAYLSAREYHKTHKAKVCIVSTAHPCKFQNTIESCTGISPEIPPRLASQISQFIKPAKIQPSFESFRDLLLDRTRST